MIGLILVTHGKLAKEFVVAMEHVVGPQKLIETVCIGPHDNMEDRRTESSYFFARSWQNRGDCGNKSSDAHPPR
jgi:mannose/fructose-specific phosphotransferase system component IIA